MYLGAIVLPPQGGEPGHFIQNKLILETSPQHNSCGKTLAQHSYNLAKRVDLILNVLQDRINSTEVMPGLTALVVLGHS